MKRLRSKLTYSNVMVTVLAFVVLAGGTAYAATEMLPKNSVGTKQLAKEAVTPAKLSKASKATLTGPKGATGSTGAQGPQGPKGDKGEKGERGDAGAALGFVRIESAGTIDATKSKNVGGLTVTTPIKGTYCLEGLPFVPQNAMATAQFGETSINAFVGVYPGCAATTQVSVEEQMTTNGAAKEAPFMLLFN
jgi:hypothetical protein